MLFECCNVIYLVLNFEASTQRVNNVHQQSLIAITSLTHCFVLQNKAAWADVTKRANQLNYPLEVKYIGHLFIYLLKYIYTG